MRKISVIVISIALLNSCGEQKEVIKPKEEEKAVITVEKKKT